MVTIYFTIMIIGIFELSLQQNYTTGASIEKRKNN